MKKILKKIHLYLALILCIPLILQGLTGATLAFQKEISEFSLRQNHVFLEGENQSQEQLIVAAQGFVPEGFLATTVRFSSEKKSSAAVRFVKEGERKQAYEVLLDPVSGEVLKVKNFDTDFFRVVKKFHASLLLSGDLGKNIVGFFGVVLLFMALSGVVLWWPRQGNFKRSVTFKFSSTGKKSHRDLHSAVGFWTLSLLLSSSITGIFLIFFKTKESSKLWHAIHEGSVFGLWGEAVVFLTGFLPLIFALTGILLWLTKKKERAARVV